MESITQMILWLEFRRRVGGNMGKYHCYSCSLKNFFPCKYIVIYITIITSFRFIQIYMSAQYDFQMTASKFQRRCLTFVDFSLALSTKHLPHTHSKWLHTVFSDVQCGNMQRAQHVNIMSHSAAEGQFIQNKRSCNWAQNRAEECNKNRTETDGSIDTEWGRDREHLSYHPPWPGREVITQLPPEPGVTLPLPRHSTHCHAASPTPESSSWDCW